MDRKNIIILAVLLLVGIFGFFIWSGYMSEKSAQESALASKPAAVSQPAPVAAPVLPNAAKVDMPKQRSIPMVSPAPVYAAEPVVAAPAPVARDKRFWGNMGYVKKDGSFTYLPDSVISELKREWSASL